MLLSTTEEALFFFDTSSGYLVLPEAGYASARINKRGNRHLHSVLFDNLGCSTNPRVVTTRHEPKNLTTYSLSGDGDKARRRRATIPALSENVRTIKTLPPRSDSAKNGPVAIFDHAEQYTGIISPRPVNFLIKK